jgi:hypothetical protein
MDHQGVYNQIINKARSENRIKGYTYYEAHHIIPKCIGGDGSINQWKSHPNIILLTAREHFICHRLLCEIYPNEPKLWYALWLMSIGKNRNSPKYKITSRTYEMLRIEFCKKIKGTPKPEGFGVGRIFNKTHLENLSLVKIGIPKPEGTGEKISKSSKGKTRNNKPAIQYDLAGTFIKEWGSATLASQQLNIHYGSISSCCLGKTKTAGGYVWKFKNN